MTHQCNECPNFTDGKCCHELKICLSNFAKNETQTDLSIKADSQYPFISLLGGYENAYKFLNATEWSADELLLMQTHGLRSEAVEQECLEYRRKNNLVVAGDYVVVNEFEEGCQFYQITEDDIGSHWIGLVLMRHATPAEIKAGHRIDFNLNDAVATAFDDLGDDKHIENHVAPQCVIGGDQ